MSSEMVAVTPDLLPCPFCGERTYLSTSDIDGWIAAVACDGCDMRGPMSEWKYADVEEAKADALVRWSAAALTRQQAEAPAAAGAGVPPGWKRATR